MTGIPGAIHVEGLSKAYSSPDGAPFFAVDGISFDAGPGRIFGLLGPNGAGKTTTLRILSTLIPPTAGTAEVDGFSVTGAPAEVRLIAVSKTVAAAEIRERILAGRPHLVLEFDEHRAEAGLITRTVDEHDRRVKRVRVTQKAREMGPEIRAATRAWNDLLLEGFSPEERELALSFLQRMADNARRHWADVETHE